MIFSHIKSKDIGSKISRIPYGNFVLTPYTITPNTKTLAEDLNNYLELLVKGTPESFDSLNGNAFDNLIDNWANRVKDEIENQRPQKAQLIKNMVSARIANKRNAEDWIIIDIESLSEINEKIREFENLVNNDLE